MKEMKEFGPWSEQLSSTGRKYFYNKETEVSQWEKPKEWRDFELEQERLCNEQKITVMQPPPPPPIFMPPFFHPPPGFPAFAPPPFHPPPFPPGAPVQFPPMPLIPPAVPPPPRAAPSIPPPVTPAPVTPYSPLPPPIKPYKPQVNITHTIDVRLDIKRSPATPSTPTTLVPPVPIIIPPPHPIQITPIIEKEVKKEVKEEKEEVQPKVLKREHESSPSEEKQAPKKMKDEEAEPWMRFYNAELAQKKRTELNLEVDGEMSDIVIQGLAVENKLIAELMKVKQAAAMVAVQEHEVLLCDGKITNLQEQQRIIQMRTDRAAPIGLPDLDDLKMQFSH